MDEIEQLSPFEREQLLNKLMKKNFEKKETTINSDIEHRYIEYSLSDVQKVYWAGNKGTLELGGRLSNIYANIALEKGSIILSRIIIQRINYAINSMIESHDILRTILLDDFRQRTLEKPLDFKVEYTNYFLSKRNSIILEEQKKNLIETDINYQEWPLFRVIVTNWRDGINIQFGISPLLMDGNGVSLFLSQIVMKVLNKNEEIKSSKLTYRDYVTYFEDERKSREYKKNKENKLSRLESLYQAPKLPMNMKGGKQEFIIDEIELLSNTEWEQFKKVVAKKTVTVPAVLLTLFTDAVTKWTNSYEYYIGMINTYHLPEMKSANYLLGNFNTIDFIEINVKLGNFMERVKEISNQFAFNYDNGRFNGFEEVRQIRITRQLGPGITFPVGFNCTVNIPHPSVSDFLSKNASKGNVIRKIVNQIVPTVSIEELNIYTTQLPFIPTMTIGENNELICKFARYENYFSDGVLEDIINLFKINAKELISNSDYWNYSWQKIYSHHGKVPKMTEKQNNFQDFKENNCEESNQLFIELKRIYLEIVNQDYISPEDNIFCLGMDSIQLIRFIEKLQKDLKVYVTPELIYNCPNLGCLSKIIGGKENYERKTV